MPLDPTRSSSGLDSLKVESRQPLAIETQRAGSVAPQRQAGGDDGGGGLQIEAEVDGLHQERRRAQIASVPAKFFWEFGGAHVNGRSAPPFPTLRLLL